MPPRKSSKRKPSMAKAKAMVAKSTKSRAKLNMDTFYCAAKTVQNVTPQQGVSVANYIYGGFSLMGGLLFQNAEFNFYRLQFDKFRVNSISVKWIPKANVMDQTVAQNDQFNTSGDGKVHTVIDRDSIAPSSIAALSRYPSYRASSIMKQWSRRYNVTYPTGVWMDCQNPALNTQVQETLGLNGTVTFYAENFLEDNYEVWNEPVAAFEVTWGIVFQGKTSGSLGFAVDENGEVTSVTITPVSATTQLEPSRLTNVRGSIKDTRTLNEVVEAVIDDQGNETGVTLGGE